MLRIESSVITRRQFVVAGGTAAAAAVALAAADSALLGAAVSPAPRLVSLACASIAEAAIGGRGRVVAASAVANGLPRVGPDSAYVSVRGFRPAAGRTSEATAREFGDFANSTLSVHAHHDFGADRRVIMWGCESRSAASSGGETAMRVSLGRRGVLPVSLVCERELSPLAHRLRARTSRGQAEVAADVADEWETVRQQVEVPLRRGIFFLGGRSPQTGRLPAWSECRVAASPSDGSLSLERVTAGASRPVDFPYLMLEIGHVATPQAYLRA